MEKAASKSSSSSSSFSRNKFMKLLPKAVAAAVSFQNPPFSPGRDKRPENHVAKLKTTHIGKGYSGAMIPMIPPEARQKSKNFSFETQEPRSPKVSCIGQIKSKHEKKMTNQSRNVSLPKDFKPYSDHHHMMIITTKKKKKKSEETMLKHAAGSSLPELKKKPSSIKKMFRSAKPAGRKSDASADHRSSLSEKAPSLSHMKRFASSRDTFANFDWTAAKIAPDHHGSDEEENEVIIPFSAPLITSGGRVALEPRKEINLWKRRTMAQPTSLQLKITSS